MSLKNVRKLLNETNDIKPIEEDDDDANNVCQPASKSRKKKEAINKLLLLEDDEDIDHRDDDGYEGACTYSSSDDQCDAGDNRSKQIVKMSKKKKRRESETESDDSDQDEEDVDIDAVVDEVNKILGPVDVESIKRQKMTKSRNDLLRVINRNLNFDEEYQSIKDVERMAVIQTSRNIPGHLDTNNTVRDPRTGRIKLQPSKARTKLIAKCWLLVNPKRHLTITNPGLTMDIVTSTKGSKSIKKDENLFKIIYSVDYQRVQNKLIELIKEDETEEVINLMNDNPNHVEGLINASSLIMKEDVNMAFELIQRSLLVYESIFPMKFNPTARRCSLNYKNPENRPFFATLFKYMTSCGKFKCFKTGLEVSKLLLSLDYTNDPLSVKLIIDYYAINAKNYDYLINFYEADVNILSKLPNMIFNTSLAYLLKSLEKAPKVTDAEKVQKAATEERQTLFNKSNELLQEAILLFPSVLRPLLDSMSVNVDASVKRCPYFYVDTTIDYPQDISPLLHDMINIFIERNSNVWKSIPDILLWLETNVKIVIQRLSLDSSLASTYQSKRYNYYPLDMITPRNVFRHVYLSGIRKVKIPKDILRPKASEEEETPSNIVTKPPKILPFDPFPPTDTLDYETKVPIDTSASTSVINETVGAVGGVLSSFVQSWLPSFNPVPPKKNVMIVARREPVHPRHRRRDRGQVEGNANQVEEGVNGNRVTNVLSAVKELLNGFSVGDDDEVQDE